MEALRAEELTKIYRGGVQALKDVTLSVGSGTIFSLLGRNGAGKTTFLRIMSTQLLPTSGRGLVLGFDVVRETGEVRKRIAVAPQESKTMYLLTVEEHVKYFLMVRGFLTSEASRRTREVLRDLALDEYADTLCMKLSGGLRRKVLVAMVVATGADVIFLDEPTTGLDPIARRLVWDVIQRAAKSGQTIFLTTHYMEEAEAVANEFAIINVGKIVAGGKIAELDKMMPYKVRAEIPIVVAADFHDFSEYGEVIKVGKRLIIYPKSEASLKKLYDYCVSRGLRISFSPIGIEDLFIRQVVARGGREKP